MDHFSPFKLFVPFTRAFVEKATGKLVIEGLASNTNLDLTNERMAPSAIQSMAKSNLPLPLTSEHRPDWDAEFGQVVELSVNANHDLMMRAELDPNMSTSHDLMAAVQKGRQLGLSIGGRVNDADFEYDDETGGPVYTYKDISLNHITVTGHPAVSETWLNTLSKSVSPEFAKASGWGCSAARDLPLGKDGSWDGPAAEERIFSWAGWPDNPQPGKAAKAFLAVNHADPKLKGSYKLPFADVEDGALKAMPAGIRAAASRLPQTDIPAAVKASAHDVISDYEKKMQSASKSEDVSMFEDVTKDEVIEPTQPVVEQPAEQPQAVEQPVVDAPVHEAPAVEQPEAPSEAPVEAPTQPEVVDPSADEVPAPESNREPDAAEPDQPAQPESEQPAAPEAPAEAGNQEAPSTDESDPEAAALPSAHVANPLAEALDAAQHALHEKREMVSELTQENLDLATKLAEAEAKLREAQEQLNTQEAQKAYVFHAFHETFTEETNHLSNQGSVQEWASFLTKRPA